MPPKRGGAASAMVKGLSFDVTMEWDDNRAQRQHATLRVPTYTRA